MAAPRAEASSPRPGRHRPSRPCTRSSRCKRSVPWPPWRAQALSALLSLQLLGLALGLQIATDDNVLNRWALSTFNNFPPSFWNNLFQAITAAYATGADIDTLKSETIGGGAFGVCSTQSFRGYQGVTCNSAGTDTVSVDLSFASLPPGQPRLEGSLWFQASAPPIVALDQLSSLNLAGNALTNKIPEELGLMRSLRRLQLQGNNFSGPIPQLLCNLNLNWRNGDCLSLADNSLQGSIPDCFKSFPCLDFQGNKLNMSTGSCDASFPYSSCDKQAQLLLAPPPPPGTSSNGLSTGVVVGIVVGCLALLGVVLACAAVLLRWRKKRIVEEKRRQLAQDVESQISSKHFGAMSRYSEEELSKACNNFDDDNILGEGGYSVVYKGTIGELDVAIKKIKPEKMKDGNELDFLNEVEIISRAAHKNLVQSLGFCVEPGRAMMLVLHYYANGSVASRTFGKEGTPLSWDQRQRIARGSADGIAYLHNDCNPKLIHRDIKAENVLLNDEDEASIADFGLAAQMDVDETHRETEVKGTIGHIAPEYIMSGHCSEKTDVYAFGTFLLELISGKSIQDLGMLAAAEELIVYDWVSKCMEEDSLDDLVDRDLEIELSGADRDEALGVLMLALRCMRTDPKERPDMQEVASCLVPRGMQEQLGKWREEAQTLGKTGLDDPIDPLQWELDNMDLGDDTIGSSILESSKFGSVQGNSAGPF